MSRSCSCCRWTGSAIGAGLIGLHPNLTESAATTIVAIFGTTISPYLFFWQSAQEVEEVDQKPDEHPLIDQPREGPEAISRIRMDTIAGMLASNLVALAIMIATAATLHAHGVTDINTAAQAAQALKPIAGRFAFALFSVGIIGTGTPCDSCVGWISGLCGGRRSGLEDRPRQHALAGARLLFGDRGGGAAGAGHRLFAGLDPIKALYWSAVLNGVIAVPMMAALMFVASSRRKMGEFRAGWVLGGLGWLSTAVMAAAAITMLYVSLKGSMFTWLFGALVADPKEAKRADVNMCWGAARAGGFLFKTRADSRSQPHGAARGRGALRKRQIVHGPIEGRTPGLSEGQGANEAATQATRSVDSSSWLVIFGAIVGWLANGIMWANGRGCARVNIAWAGRALAGGFLFQSLSGNFSFDQHGFIVSTVVAVIGAVIVLAIWNAITGRQVAALTVVLNTKAARLLLARLHAADMRQDAGIIASPGLTPARRPAARPVWSECLE